MKKTVFSILIGLVLFGFMGCKTNSNNLVTYNTTCITSNEMNEKIHFVYQPKTDKYQFARYYTPSFKWYDSAEKDETNKVNTLQFWGNINFKKMENQPVYSKIEKSNMVYSYKEDAGYTKVEDLTCTVFCSYFFDPKNPTVEYQEDDMTVMIFTRDGKTYYNFVNFGTNECSLDENCKLDILYEKGKLFYELNSISPLEEREYIGTTTDNETLFYVVEDFIN